MSVRLNCGKFDEVWYLKYNLADFERARLSVHLDLWAVLFREGRALSLVSVDFYRTGFRI